MSNQEDNTANENLRDFLNKSKISENGPIDDFEKEALEGFSMLENEEDVLNLKSSLDAKIYKEVFAEEKKPGRIIWYAAAGLALLIGLSVYFIQNNPVTKSDNLAIQSHTSSVHESDSRRIQKSLNEVSKENENLRFKKAENPPEIKSSEPKNAKGEKEFHKNVNPQKNEKNSDQNSNAESASGELVTQEVKPQTVPVLAPIEGEKVMMQPSASSGAVSLGATKDLTADYLNNSSFSVTKNDATTAGAEIKKTKPSHNKKRSKNEEQTVAADANSTVAGPSGKSCLYSGGEEALLKDLKTILSSKKLLQKFDATLFINENKKVVKVIFTETYGLSKTDQKELIDLLKTLDKFEMIGVSGKNLAEYKLVYRP